MQEFIDECLARPSFSKQCKVLERLIEDPRAHARFLNTLSRLEYVGVRKMLKSRRADELDLDGLRHILEEAVHALRLKKFAHAVAPEGLGVETFAEEHTLEGDAAEDYFQEVDRAAEAQCVGVPSTSGTTNSPSELCYWLTSTAIEIRARSFYPAYQRLLEVAGTGISVASIVADEQEHLAQMGAELPKHLPDWQSALEAVMQAEEAAFCAYLDKVQAHLEAVWSDRNLSVRR